MDTKDGTDLTKRYGIPTAELAFLRVLGVRCGWFFGRSAVLDVLGLPDADGCPRDEIGLARRLGLGGTALAGVSGVKRSSPPG